MCRTSKYYVYVIYQDKVNISQVHFCGERTFIRVPKETRLNKYGIPFENPWDVIVKADVIFSNGEVLIKNPEQSDIKLLPYNEQSYEALYTLYPNKKIPKHFNVYEAILTASDELNKALNDKNINFVQKAFDFYIQYADEEIGSIKIVTSEVDIWFEFNGKIYDLVSNIIDEIDNLISSKTHNIENLKAKYKGHIYQNEKGDFWVFDKLGNVSTRIPRIKHYNVADFRVEKAIEPNMNIIKGTLDAYEFLLVQNFKSIICQHPFDYNELSRSFIIQGIYKDENIVAYIEYDDGLKFRTNDRRFPGFESLLNYLLRIYFPEIPENKDFRDLKLEQDFNEQFQRL